MCNADTLLDNLTVYEMLAYTAELKNPMEEPFDKKRAKVEMVIQQLASLAAAACASAAPLARGISGAPPAQPAWRAVTSLSEDGSRRVA